MSDQPDHRIILKRCGIIFLMVGLLDIGLLFYCIRHSIPVKSSLSMIGIIGGVYLLRGNLRTAAFMQWGSVFLSTLLISWLLILPWLLPGSLVALAVRLNPLTVPVGLAFVFTLIGAFLWTARDLGSEPVAHARAEIGRKPIRVRFPLLFGALLPVIATGLFVALQSSAVGQRAVAEAREDQGPEYRYFLTGIHCTWNAEESWYLGKVTAWDDHEIVELQVSWREAR